MIARNKRSGSHRAPGRAHDLPGNIHLEARCHCTTASEGKHMVAHDLANKPSARILIETEANGRVDLFQFIPFHSPAR